VNACTLGWIVCVLGLYFDAGFGIAGKSFGVDYLWYAFFMMRVSGCRYGNFADAIL